MSASETRGRRCRLIGSPGFRQSASKTRVNALEAQSGLQKCLNCGLQPAWNIGLARRPRKHVGCWLVRADRIRRKLGFAGMEAGAKKPRAQHRGAAEGCKALLRHFMYSAIKIRPVNERSTGGRPAGDIGIRVTSPIPCPSLRIPCQPRNVSLRRPDEFPAPPAQGICRNPLTKLCQSCGNRRRDTRSGKISLPDSLQQGIVLTR